ncbi:hypothetical protein KIL84_019546 [Mauremys mutica]|uniref:HD domain-containing protein n=1 Tax=Mauremys mutica TaxID=74926 RepID=A0A9D3XVU8_9SAUR|nr:hypothetical protein KIL84_019546 [Mauremys mutica]
MARELGLEDHINAFGRSSVTKEGWVRLALVHDTAECTVGDIAPADNISKEEKRQREEAAMKHLTQLLSEDLRKENYELWEEYEHQSTAEVRFVKELDQREMILQASAYEELEKMPGRRQYFYDSTSGKCNPSEVVQLVSSINIERNTKIAATASEPRS